MTRRTAVAAFLVLAAGAPALAHEGHDHKVMGTVSAVHANALDVKSVRDGNVSRVTLTGKTRVLRGKTVLKPADIRVGDRVVVTAVTEKDAAGKESLVAREIRVGSAAAPGE